MPRVKAAKLSIGNWPVNSSAKAIPTSMPQVVNKFATQILHTYRQDYAAMHREDVENDSAYKLRYTLHSATVFSEKAVTYRSEVRRVGKECRSRWSPHH